MTANNAQVLFLIYGVTYVTKVLGTPGLPLHLPPVSSLQVLLLIYGGHTVCNRGAETTGLYLHLPPVSCLQVRLLIYSKHM